MLVEFDFSVVMDEHVVLRGYLPQDKDENQLTQQSCLEDQEGTSIVDEIPRLNTDGLEALLLDRHEWIPKVEDVLVNLVGVRDYVKSGHFDQNRKQGVDVRGKRQIQ